MQWETSIISHKKDFSRRCSRYPVSIPLICQTLRDSRGAACLVTWWMPWTTAGASLPIVFGGLLAVEHCRRSCFGAASPHAANNKGGEHSRASCACRLCQPLGLLSSKGVSWKSPLWACGPVMGPIPLLGWWLRKWKGRYLYCQGANMASTLAVCGEVHEAELRASVWVYRVPDLFLLLLSLMQGFSFLFVIPFPFQWCLLWVLLKALGDAFPQYRIFITIYPLVLLPN